MTEARWSATYTATSPDGRSVLITRRGADDMSADEYLDDLDKLEKELSIRGYDSSGGQSFGRASSQSGSQSKGTGEWEDQPASPKQKGLLMDKGLWKDGMTKAKASEIIGNLLGK